MKGKLWKRKWEIGEEGKGKTKNSRNLLIKIGETLFFKKINLFFFLKLDLNFKFKFKFFFKSKININK